MPNDSLLPFSFPAIRGKKVTAAFDGGRLSSDGGVMLLCEAERRLGIAARLTALFPDDRDGTRVIHGVSDMIRARIFAIACGVSSRHHKAGEAARYVRQRTSRCLRP